MKKRVLIIGTTEVEQHLFKVHFRRFIDMTFVDKSSDEILNSSGYDVAYFHNMTGEFKFMRVWVLLVQNYGLALGSTYLPLGGVNRENITVHDNWPEFVEWFLAKLEIKV